LAAPLHLPDRIGHVIDIEHGNAFQALWIRRAELG
jgi:hypothetical protein